MIEQTTQIDFVDEKPAIAEKNLQANIADPAEEAKKNIMAKEIVNLKREKAMKERLHRKAKDKI